MRTTNKIWLEPIRFNIPDRLKCFKVWEVEMMQRYAKGEDSKKLAAEYGMSVKALWIKTKRLNDKVTN